MEDDLSTLQAVRALSKDNLDAPPPSPGAIAISTYTLTLSPRSRLFFGAISCRPSRMRSILIPHRIAAVPSAVLDVVKEQETASQPTNTTNTIRRNPVGGLVEAAWENYTHIDNPNVGPPLRGPQVIPDEKLPPSSINPPALTNSGSNSNVRAPQTSSSPGSNDITETMMNARLGDTDAQVALGDLYRLGQGVHQDFQTSMDWYLLAAEKGNPVGQRRVGALYDHGIGVPAANQGDAAAQRKIGVLYHGGRGVSQDHSVAMQWYLKAAELRDSAAQYAIGLMYHRAQGVPQSSSEALMWYLKAAEQDHAQAQCNIGYLYNNGQDGTQDHSKALYWYLKSADQDNIIALYNIALFYHRGRCSLEQYNKAMQGLKKAADRGDSDAKRYHLELQR
ncbi:hypothetical protein BGX24_001682 [Mortierella sp. AD032]|nr:hypothetical protein BGX24_001682 [Mortierella sp. AD032]